MWLVVANLVTAGTTARLPIGGAGPLMAGPPLLQFPTVSVHSTVLWEKGATIIVATSY